MKFLKNAPVLLLACALSALIVWALTYSVTENNAVNAANITAIVVAGLYAFTLPPAYAYSFRVVKNADFCNPTQANFVMRMYMGYGHSAIWTLPIFVSPLFFYYYLKELFRKTEYPN